MSVNFGSLLESVGTLLAVLTPLVAVPLTVITFYLRSLREHQVTWHADLVRRMEAAETALTSLRRDVLEFGRDYTTKEEWLREELGTKRQIERLREAAIRIETAMQTSRFVDQRRPFSDGGGRQEKAEPPHSIDTRAGYDEDRQ